jgi:hypothetical protein
MKNALRFALILASLTAAAFADPVKITRNQASELYQALATLDAGVTPANIGLAAENLVALRPAVEALDKAKTAAQRDARGLTVEANAAAIRKLEDSLDAFGSGEVTVDLKPFRLTDDEIEKAKIRPIVLAVLRQHLTPKK